MRATSLELTPAAVKDYLAHLVQGEVETPLAMLAQKARAIGIHLDQNEANLLLAKARAMADQLKRPLSDRDLSTLYSGSTVTAIAA